MISRVDDAEAARAQRANERRARGMTFEVVALGTPAPPLHSGESPEERWAAMARLCLRAWLATGRPLPSTRRADVPGERFWVDDGGVRRAL